MPSKEPLWSVAETIKIFGLRTEETLRLWRKEGCPHEVVSGRPMFNLPKVLAWRDERRAKAVEPKTLAEAEERKAIAEASLAELKFKRENDEVVTRAVVRAAWLEAVTAFRSAALSLPSRYAPKLVGVKTLASASRILDEAMREALTAMAEREW